MTIQNLLETSVPKSLQHIPKQWEHHSDVDGSTKQKIATAMNGSNFTHFPLPETRSEPDADVIEHLFKHGYDVHDYEKGIASKVTKVGDPARGIPLRDKVIHEKIGSVLEKTGADQSVKTSFMNDPSRSATRTNSSNLHVVISTSPLAIAGMSTGTNWDDKSCMNLVKGGNSRYLEDDSRHGTHVAYLVHGSDHTALEHGEPQHPIARIALKPYHAMTESGRDTIFLPENKTWGMDDTRFSNAVSDWVHANYPAKTGHTYKKNDAVYDDTGNRYHKEYTQEEFNTAVNNDNIPRNISVSHDIVSGAIKNTEGLDSKTQTKHLLAITQIPGLSSKNISHLLHLSKNFDYDRNDELHSNLGESNGDRLPKSALKHFDDYDGFGIPNRVLMNPRLPDSIIDKISVAKYQYVRRSLLKPRHIDKIVNKYLTKPSTYSNSMTLLSSKLSKQNIKDITDKVATDKDFYMDNTAFVVNSPEFDKTAHDHWIDSRAKHSKKYTSDTDHFLQHSRHASVDDLPKIDSSSGLFALINNKNIPEHERVRVKDYFINKAVNNTEVREGKLTKYIFPHETPNGFLQDSRKEKEYKIPSHLSEKFTDRDYQTLAAKKYSLNFEDPEHSHAYLNAIHKNMVDADNNGDKSATENHLSTYLASIKKHLTEHGGPLTRTLNKYEFERTLPRLTDPLDTGTIHKLKTVDAPQTEKYKTVLGLLNDYKNFHEGIEREYQAARERGNRRN